MRYSKTFNQTIYSKISEKCGNEKCYCQPYNSPLEIIHSLTLDDIKRITCDTTVTEYTVLSLHYSDLSAVTTYLLNANQYYMHQDEDYNTYIRLLEHFNHDCFYFTITISYVSGRFPSGTSMTFVTEPYCRVGSNKMQYVLAEYDESFDIYTTYFTLSDGCAVSIQNCSGFHIDYLVIPGLGGFLLVSFDTSYFGGAEIEEVFGGVISAAPTIIQVHDQACVPYFRIQPSFSDGLGCNGFYHFTGWITSATEAHSICGNTYRTIVGQVFTKPNSFGSKFAGDTQIVIGQSATKNIQLASTNDNNIASWALNELGAMLSSKGIKVINCNDPEIDKEQVYIMRDTSQEIHIQPNQELENKYLSVALKSKDCLNYFTC